MRTALLIGASGLVGGILLNKLLKNNSYSKVTILSRRILEIKDPKLERVIVNFDAIEKYEDVIKADDIFSTMGTTTGSAGSKEMYSKIEFDYVYNTAKIALKNGASRFLTVSSAGANINSQFFYTKIKGKIEDAISRLGFDAVYIFQAFFYTRGQERTPYRREVNDVYGKTDFPFVNWPAEKMARYRGKYNSRNYGAVSITKPDRRSYTGV